ncbi:MAG: hypothetical protein A2725_04845 [Candidatus Magasanikbacteria bacterium RIFCSPHIGHO2_01_FULL_33_34]|uniref:Antitoxin n=1 Tax=Candidatus Magasanikbacteria bacterium RIFCSPHIGHO2_01_FULL_33_34 TaxID=1798671 RepID=A0A1F6LLE6_9BACT|nr:MAG: hypothetical protein A2725_04845 [Candidatus Magasanikbacteria bacterium RIFCSPHIGHO2_01_FULL_33_34]OGH66001.1 MAG: hypothetical protein A3B83_02665 [Candidatus Magasanikbacteria bacterium RIFCSPHIGHO2_02_FULL_33_17]OGH76396.1 MAG: hypothetical protein A3A89_01205 [Candidatus Magasanikbacteria bacterium RIFCSPLOWO2_01_FULL_33_34]OGH81502.1 MAG: hypothetical protein A3F93_01505 [Candidatus Magasanikbacteria bacterium RIFCSPLOWO2_12_FULL_34_7]
MSLDRLINLARKTGDRLIVHQPEKGEDIVIMNVDEYEMLLDNRRDVRNLSDKQLLDQINRDIAIWRANTKLEDDDIYDDFVDEEGGRDIGGSWFSAGNVLSDKFDESEIDFTDEVKESEGGLAEFFDYEGVGNESLSNVKEISKPYEVDEDMVKDIEPKIIPQKSGEEKNQVWEEESLGDDEPVFYEEPV